MAHRKGVDLLATGEYQLWRTRLADRAVTRWAEGP
jgi:hypothetical protein